MSLERRQASVHHPDEDRLVRDSERRTLNEYALFGNKFESKMLVV